MIIISVFIALQVSLLLFMALHDWVHIPPLTNMQDLKKAHSWQERLLSSAINTMMVFVPLLLTWHYRPQFPMLVLLIMILAYGCLTLGTILAWWIPYLCGQRKFKKLFC